MIQSKLLLLYRYLLSKHGSPGSWPWFGHDKPHTQEEIAIGAILTQNTSWHNVQAAITNLRRHKANTLKAIYILSKTNPQQLKNLIRPAGFYNQKASYLANFCSFIVENYRTLLNFFKLSLPKSRPKLLSLKGIGPETADTILLYAGHKPIFVIDAYTRRFARHYRLSKKQNYLELQQYFQARLPKKVKLYQDFHALIVTWGKNFKV